MAVDPRKRQKKLERRASQRKAKVRQIVKEKSAGFSQLMRAADAYPVHRSWATCDLWTSGIGWVCVSRLLGDGSVAFALFLVDRYCLGVKNAIADVRSRFDYESSVEHKTRSQFSTDTLSPETARHFVEQAVEYAHGLGFPPHPDYQVAKLIFGNLDSGNATQDLELGKDGKPFFISGPNDNAQRCRRIVETLELSRGTGNFHFLVGGPVDRE